MDRISSGQTESGLQSELDRLASRLAQGQRDHQRSRDELQKLEGEIRQVETDLHAAQRERTGADSDI